MTFERECEWLRYYIMGSDKGIVCFFARKGWLLRGVALLVFSALAAMAVFGVPTGPDTFTVDGSSGFTGGLNGTLIEAEAGNVTSLILAENFESQSWAGYYGNVTGTIVLNDGSNNTLYNWKLANPTGEVYASNGSDVSWSLVSCVNLTANNSMNYTLNHSTLDRFFGINQSDLDGFNETFNDTYLDAAGFFVGDIRIDDQDRCPMLFSFVDNAYQVVSFKEVLLTDNKSVIFTALLNNSLDNFKSGVEPSDFQMLVGEDGHLGKAFSLTNYYFFVELT
ncbi:hypothetical protein HY640_00450 [Candidatus Woesearchaeota archaeon]|nr:hypothetical protein [Candidatus Woesearchaeota archaeon]